MLRYTLRQLEYLIACIDTGSLVAAADKLNVSQPSVSAAIAKLEDELGTQLLIRHHAQGVVPTATASQMLQSARSLLNHAHDLQRWAQSTGDNVAGELNLGSFISLAPAYLPRLTAELSQTHPEISLNLNEGTQSQLIDGLRNGYYDLALLYDVDLPEDLEVTKLAEVMPHVLLPEIHPLAHKPKISLHELANEPLILLDVPPSRQYFSGLLKSVGITPRIAFTSPSLELVRGLVGQNLGYSLLVTRPYGDQTYDGKRLIVRAIKDRVSTNRIVLARLQAVRPTRAILAFEAFATAQFKNLKSAMTSDPSSQRGQKQ